MPDRLQNGCRMHQKRSSGLVLQRELIVSVICVYQGVRRCRRRRFGPVSTSLSTVSTDARTQGPKPDKFLAAGRVSITLRGPGCALRLKSSLQLPARRGVLSIRGGRGATQSNHATVRCKCVLHHPAPDHSSRVLAVHAARSFAHWTQRAVDRE
jgi:hypothetical protein